MSVDLVEKYLLGFLLQYILNIIDIQCSKNKAKFNLFMINLLYHKNLQESLKFSDVKINISYGRVQPNIDSLVCLLVHPLLIISILLYF